MPQLLPVNFLVEHQQNYLPFITQAELSHTPFHSACCHFDVQAYSPQLAEDLGVVLPQALQHAVKKRQAEYLASRWLVTQLLTTLAIPNFQLLNRADRSPIWPEGVSGSLSHHGNKVFAMIASNSYLVGTDIEKNLTAQRARELQSMIMSSAELARMTAAGFSLAQATTLIFSIKEALYKAVFPVVQKLFGFEQATVTAVNPLLNQISLELSPAIWPAQHGPSSWQAHYWQSDSEVLSWLVAPRS